MAYKGGSRAPHDPPPPGYAPVSLWNSDRTTPKKFKNATDHRLLWKPRPGKSRGYRDDIVFGKLIFKMFSFLTGRNWKPGFFKFLRFQERLKKAPFSWRISVDESYGSPSRSTAVPCVELEKAALHVHCSWSFNARKDSNIKMFSRELLTKMGK